MSANATMNIVNQVLKLIRLMAELFYSHLVYALKATEDHIINVINRTQVHVPE